MVLQGAPAAPVFPEFSVEGEGIRFHGGRPAVVLVERAGERDSGLYWHGGTPFGAASGAASGAAG